MYIYYAELIKAIENNKDNTIVNDLLRGAATENLEEGCLDRALQFAVRNDHPQNVGKLVVKGAKDLEQSLKYAKDADKPKARAMLLLLLAAQTGDIAIVQKVFREPAPGLKDPQEYEDEGFHQVQEAVLGGEVCTPIPIEVARRHCQSGVREKLLLKTDVNREEGSVLWHGLRLMQVDMAWLRNITWVKKFRLARNALKTLPPEIGSCLQQVSIFP